MYTLKELKQFKKDKLINMVYNNYVQDWSDSQESDSDDEDCLNKKRIPYIGWYWRDTDFVNKKISIGNAQGYIGVMENNKWGYGERYMTPEEADIFIGFIDKAIGESKKGGIVSEIHESVYEVFKEMRDWMQTLRM